MSKAGQPHYFSQTSYKLKSSEAEESLIEFISRVLNSESIQKNRVEETLKNLQSFRDASILIADLVFKTEEELEGGSGTEAIKVEDDEIEREVSFSFGLIEEAMDNVKVKREGLDTKVEFNSLDTLAKEGTLELRVLFHLLPILDTTLSYHLPLVKSASLSVSDFGTFLLQGFCYTRFKNYFCHLLTSLKLAGDVVLGKTSYSLVTQQASFGKLFSKVSERIHSCEPSDTRVSDLLAFIHPFLKTSQASSSYFLNLTPVVIKLIGAGHHFLPNATLFVFETIFEVFHQTRDVHYLELLGGFEYLGVSSGSCTPVSTLFIDEIFNSLHSYFICRNSLTRTQFYNSTEHLKKTEIIFSQSLCRLVRELPNTFSTLLGCSHILNLVLKDIGQCLPLTIELSDSLLYFILKVEESYSNDGILRKNLDCLHFSSATSQAILLIATANMSKSIKGQFLFPWASEFGDLESPTEESHEKPIKKPKLQNTLSDDQPSETEWSGLISKNIRLLYDLRLDNSQRNWIHEVVISHLSSQAILVLNQIQKLHEFNLEEVLVLFELGLKFLPTSSFNNIYMIMGIILESLAIRLSDYFTKHPIGVSWLTKAYRDLVELGCMVYSVNRNLDCLFARLDSWNKKYSVKIWSNFLRIFIGPWIVHLPTLKVQPSLFLFDPSTMESHMERVGKEISSLGFSLVDDSEDFDVNDDELFGTVAPIGMAGLFYLFLTSDVYRKRCSGIISLMIIYSCFTPCPPGFKQYGLKLVPGILLNIRQFIKFTRVKLDSILSKLINSVTENDSFETKQLAIRNLSSMVCCCTELNQTVLTVPELKYHFKPLDFPCSYCDFEQLETFRWFPQGHVKQVASVSKLPPNTADQISWLKNLQTSIIDLVASLETFEERRYTLISLGRMIIHVFTADNSMQDSPMKVLSNFGSVTQTIQIASRAIVYNIINAPLNKDYKQLFINEMIQKTDQFFNDCPTPETFEESLTFLTNIGKMVTGPSLLAIIKILSMYLYFEDRGTFASIYHKLHTIASAHQKQPRTLILSTWVDLMDHIAGDFKNNLTMIQNYAAVLSQDLPSTIRLLTKHLVPRFVQDCDTDSLVKISEAWKDSLNEKHHQEILLPVRVCVHTLDHIMARLLMLSPDQAKKPIEFLLTYLSRLMSSINLETIINSCSSSLILVLVQELGSHDSDIASKAEWALDKMARFSLKKGKHSTAIPDHKSLILSQLMHIIASFNGLLSEYHEDQHRQMKLLRALNIVVSLSDNQIGKCTPQLLSTLNLSVQDPFLVTYGIIIFDTLISNTTIPVLSLFINQIITILINCYHNLSTENKTIVLKTLQFIYEKSDKIPNIMLVSFPSNQSDFAPLNQLVKSTRSSKTLPQLFEFYSELLNKETNPVCQLVLEDFLTFLNENQALIATWSLDEPINQHINSAVHALTNLCKRFPSSEEETIHRLVMGCFGSLGAIDPDRLIPRKPTSQSNQVFRPYDRNSCISFASDLIENHLYTLYTGSDAIKSHFGVAYAIQELMKFCDFNHSTITTNYGSETAPVSRKLWDGYSVDVKEAILPLLNGNYTVNNNFQVEAKTLFYNHSVPFETWVCEWTSFLITQVNHEASKEMFCSCFSAAEKSVEIASHLLPYLILTLILQNDYPITNQIHGEMMFILNEAARLDSPSHSHQFLNKFLREIFLVFEFFTHWECAFKEEEFIDSKLDPKRVHLPTSRTFMKPDKIIETFTRFIESIPNTLMADAARKVFSHIHALFYLELCANEVTLHSKNHHLLVPIFNKLHETYFYLDDADALQGLQSILLVSSPEQQLREHETEKNWPAAQTCYEVLATTGSDYQSCQKGITNCLKNMGSLDLATHHMLGLSLQLHSENLNSELQQALDESKWRLSQWDNELVDEISNQSNSIDSCLGQLLSTINNNSTGDPTGFLPTVESIYKQLLPDFLGNIASSYNRAYGSLVWLHILNEASNFEKGFRSVADSARMDFVDSSLRLWDLRFNSTTSSFKIREKILNFQRVLIATYFRTKHHLTKSYPEEINQVITRNLIQCAKLARKEGYFQLAYKAILSFPNPEDASCVIERAKWYWSQGQNWKAIQALTKLLGDEAPDLMMSEFRAKSKEKLRNHYTVPRELSYARLVLIKWMIQSSACSQAVIVHEFTKLKQDQSNWDKCHFHAAQYYLNTIASIAVHYNIDQVSSIADMVQEVVHCCYDGLKLSSKYVHQLLPRTLTTWIHWSMATHELKHLQGSPEKVKCLQEKMALAYKKMVQLAKELPSHYFLVVLSQLISRFDIVLIPIWNVIHMAVYRVMRDFPHQTLWLMVSTANSKDPVRKKHYDSVLKDILKLSSKFSPIHKDLESFTHTLLNLSSANAPKTITECLLTKLLPNYTNPQPLSTLMPTSKALSYNLPSAISAKDSSDFTPFPKQFVSIDRILPNVKIMTSLMRPLRISLLGSDQRSYTFLVKAEDDLRKDARINEFNNILNRLFNQHPESRRRQLHIRTFTALPLTHAAGLIEWVPHTEVYRNCLVNIGLSHNMKFPDPGLLEKLNENIMRSREDNIALFENKILPISPVVFYKWFLSKFPDPFRWLTARQAYAHTCATMSMVGFVIGLGDRHSENILMDETTGDLIHVDLSCVFERGLDLKFPEFVPFRLTHNMVHALGATGYEGTFRKSCETTMYILRSNKDTLKTLLETFLYDPMGDFLKAKVFNSNLISNREKLCRVMFIEKFIKDPPHRFLSSSSPANNPHALWALKRISDKLEGVAVSVFPPPPDQPHPALSVEGQVLNLILSATDSENLCRLYVGWYAHF